MNNLITHLIFIIHLTNGFLGTFRAIINSRDEITKLREGENAIHIQISKCFSEFLTFLTSALAP